MILPLISMASLSIIVSFVFYIIKNHTFYKDLPESLQQGLIGIAFGIVAIMGTEHGYEIGGAIVNARDAAPLCAGLLFSAPAGIIAGLMGGFWRWVSVSLGAGAYSRVACSISTALAGIIAGALRVHVFDRKRTNWVFSFFIAAIVEVLHMTILFLTHLDAPQKAFEICQISTIPMVLCNGLAVMIASLGITILSNMKHKNEKHYKKISQLVQTPLLVAVTISIILSTVLVYYVQTGSSKIEAQHLLTVHLDNVKKDILSESDDKLLAITRDIATELNENPTLNLKKLGEYYEVASIYIVNNQGIIVGSMTGEYIGYDMNSDADLPEDQRQSSEFMILLEEGCNEYVQQFRPLAIDNTVYRKLAGVKLSAGGFVQVGYDLDQFRKDIRSQMKILAANRRIGKNGYIIITDENNNIVSTKEEYDNTSFDKYCDIKNVTRDKVFETSIFDEKVFVVVTESEGFNIIGILSEAEIYSTRNNMMYIYTYLEILIFAALFLVIYIIVKLVIVNNIREVNKSLSKIIDGDLKTTVNVHSSEEFASLSDDINSTVETLKSYIDEASRRIEKELTLARNIQHSSLPSMFPAFPLRTEFEIYAMMDAAREVGGDFYDFYFVDQNKLAILIADVSGKGIPGAMFMMRAKSIIKSFAETQIPVNEILTKANEKLCEGNDAEMFVTCWMGIVDLETGHMEFSNAGHNPPIVYHKDQKATYLKVNPGFVLAGFENVRYKLNSYDFQPGDRIYLYTDGVTEATDANKQLYGEKRLLECVQSNINLNTQQLLECIRNDVKAFVKDEEQFDDITMLMFDYLGVQNNNMLDERIYTAHVDQFPEAMRFIEEKMEKADVPMKASTQVSVAFEEMFVNIANYAYPNHKGEVKVKAIVENNCIEITLTDSGIPFNPLEHKNPDISLSSEQRGIGGLGIYMVKKTMDEVEYKFENNQNIFTMRKYYE